MCQASNLVLFGLPLSRTPSELSRLQPQSRSCSPWKAGGVGNPLGSVRQCAGEHLSVHYPENPMVPLCPPSCQREWRGPCKCTLHSWCDILKRHLLRHSCSLVQVEGAKQPVEAVVYCLNLSCVCCLCPSHCPPFCTRLSPLLRGFVLAIVATFALCLSPPVFTQQPPLGGQASGT